MDSKDSVSIVLESLKKPIDFNQFEDEIMKPYTYANKCKKKLVITMLAAFKHWFDIPKDKREEVEEIYEYLVQIAITIDDIVDDAKPTPRLTPTYVAHGLPATLICCEYANYKLIEKIWKSNNVEILKHLVDFGLCGYYGQGVEVYWRENFICPTLSEYFMMLKGKGAGFSIPMYKIIQSYCENKTNYDEILDLFATYVQCFNDYRNLFKPENENTGQVFADDLTEGKFSFPLVHAISTLHNQEVADILKQRPTDLETKRRCVQILKDIGTQKYCHEVISELGKILLKKIEEVGGNPILEMVIAMTSNLYTS